MRQCKELKDIEQQRVVEEEQKGCWGQERKVERIRRLQAEAEVELSTFGQELLGEDQFGQDFFDGQFHRA